MRPRHPLAREIAFWLTVKVFALAALFFLFFSPAHRPEITPERLDGHLLAPGISASGMPGDG